MTLEWSKQRDDIIFFSCGKLSFLPGYSQEFISWMLSNFLNIILFWWSALIFLKHLELLWFIDLILHFRKYSFRFNLENVCLLFILFCLGSPFFCCLLSKYIIYTYKFICLYIINIFSFICLFSLTFSFLELFLFVRDLIFSCVSFALRYL